MRSQFFAEKAEIRIIVKGPLRPAAGNPQILQPLRYIFIHHGMHIPAIVDVLCDRTRKMIALFEDRNPGAAGHLVLAGGVAANQEIRSSLEAIVAEAGWTLDAPPLALCTDNAAMIAWAGLERMDKFPPSPFELAPRSRWPLDEVSDAVVGSGRRGPKA